MPTEYVGPTLLAKKGRKEDTALLQPNKAQAHAHTCLYHSTHNIVGCLSDAPANGALNLAHHAKVNISQPAVPHLEEIARVGVTVVVPLFKHLLQAAPHPNLHHLQLLSAATSLS